MGKAGVSAQWWLAGQFDADAGSLAVLLSNVNGGEPC